MSIENLELATDSDTYVAPTGGSTPSNLLILSTDGKHIVAIDNGVDFADRTEIEFSTKPPKASVSAPAGYTQARCSAFIKQPIEVGPNDVRTVNTFSIAFNYDPNTTEDDKLKLRMLAIQVIGSSELLNFWQAQSRV